MSSKNRASRAAELRSTLLEAARLYYNEGAPPMSDADYDTLYRELQQLEAEQPELITPDSPTQRVGAPLESGSDLESGEHLAPMLSIESLTSLDEVTEFVARARKNLELEEDAELQWICEPKFDGVSASLLYEDGLLTRALSRGDGTRGEVITHNIRTIRNVPLSLQAVANQPPPRRIEVRGEVLLGKARFAEMTRQMEEAGATPFRNPRNTVAGTLKLLDPTVVAKRRLDFICWGTGAVEGLELPTYAEWIERLRAWGFQTAADALLTGDPAGIASFHTDLESRREAIDYEMDGVVAKVDRSDYRHRLGRTARTPRFMLAFKFPPRRGTTRVERIVAQVGRTGKVTPVAELEPVELAGVTVSRATLHNWGLLAERDVREGDEVEVERAGDVIPAVVQVHVDRRGKDSRPVDPPTQCPTCSQPLESEGAFLYCVNIECPDTVRARIVHFASRRALDIERLGAKNVDQLVGAGLLKRLEDIYSLPAHEAEILELERWGEKSFQRLAEEIERAKRPEFARFLNALGIRQVGEQTARDLADSFDTLEALRDADSEALEQVHGVGPEVATSIRGFFELPQNQQCLAAMASAGLQLQYAKQAESETGAQDFAGRVFCFTGGLSTMSRDDAKALVEARGARTSSSVTKKVTDVVAGEKAGSKLEKAQKLELNILTEDEFRALLETGAESEG